jgi:hypothetical protein
MSCELMLGESYGVCERAVSLASCSTEREFSGEMVTSSELQKFRRRVGDFVLQMCRYALDLPEMRLARRPW